MDMQNPLLLQTTEFCKKCWKPAAKMLPHVFAVLLFAAAALLLFSAVTPTEPARLRWVYKFIPLSVMEISHLVSSLSGIGLMFLSLAIRQRVDSAYYLTISCLTIAIASLLLKGWEIEQATLLTLLLIMFIPTRAYFYRKSKLLSMSLSRRWTMLSVFILAASTVLGFMSYKHTAYSNDLWLKFTLQDEPSRFLRSLVISSLICMFFLLYRFLTRTYNGLNLPDDTDIARAQSIIRNSPESMSFLALMKDKYLFWSTTGGSFIMFGITPKYWIAMGDPIGTEAEFDDLIWKFREAADQHSARIAFYEVSNRYVSQYLDAGMSLMKIGEQARVNLPNFTLEGKGPAKLRQALNRGTKENLVFEIVAPENLHPILPRLREISDEWLKTKKTREKSFSLGRFDDTYLCYSHVAIVKQEGQIVAFSNLFTPDNKEEISLDLMRYNPQAPNGIMEYLTIQSIIWGQSQGYQWFNLGMAPLAGLYNHHLASTWHKVGHLVFRFGGEFYNFKGLYQYKNKFQPEWKSRYLACPGNLSGTAILFAVAGLIARGFKGIFKN